MARRRKSSRAEYARMYDDPTRVFNVPELETLLAPNGAHEIWIRSQGQMGLGVRVTASIGPHGFRLHVEPIGFEHPISVFGLEDRTESRFPTDLPDARSVELVIYRNTPAAQEFKDWCKGERRLHRKC